MSKIPDLKQTAETDDETVYTRLFAPEVTLSDLARVLISSLIQQPTRQTMLSILTELTRLTKDQTFRILALTTARFLPACGSWWPTILSWTDEEVIHRLLTWSEFQS